MTEPYWLWALTGLKLIERSRPGVPSPRASDWDPWGVCQEPGPEQEVSQGALLFAVPHLCLWRPLLSATFCQSRGSFRFSQQLRPHARGLGRVLLWEPSRKHFPTPVCGKTAFLRTGPWCQKAWGLVLSTEALRLPERGWVGENMCVRVYIYIYIHTHIYIIHIIYIHTYIIHIIYI